MCYIPKEHSSSPTISLEVLFTSIVIDTHKRRYLLVFMSQEHTSMLICQKKIHHIKIERELVDIMCEVNPEYRNNVRVENCVKLLYLQILKALYGCMESELLWYDLCTKTLK